MHISQFLSITSTIALGTLGAITYILSRRAYVHLFIIVGQDVFRWLTPVLFAVLVTRTLTLFHVLSTTVSRNFNSIIFFLAVAGIIWSVARHGKSY